MPTQVKLLPHRPGTPDGNATVALLQAYSDDNGFHCPRCGATITNPNYAIEHLAQEINASFAKLDSALKEQTPNHRIYIPEKE